MLIHLTFRFDEGGELVVNLDIRDSGSRDYNGLHLNGIASLA